MATGVDVARVCWCQKAQQVIHAEASIEDEVCAVKAASEVMLKLQPGPPGGNTVLYTGSGAAGEGGRLE